ncbi:DNA translocase FtsK [Mobilitalea sibirica]|uniref:DNA translocase FtsK n=1 Tax=Mobilitalea sibirica TaxID=1462919 RepID=A0A8J7H103_9FIRM|nr:DNA translocase FtsK [Mobilitalea sibirica]MBH1942279.1 DNA translocase FtsK [Mobilitalea sibirica]
MASKRKPKKSNNKQTNRKQTVKKKETIKESGALQDEIILVVALVVSVLLFLSNFNLIGPVGRYVSGFVFGMIGLEAYLLPFILFFGTAFHLSNFGNRSAGRKILSAIVFFVVLTGLIQLIATSYNKDLRIFDYYNLAMEGRNGGGIIGGILVMILGGLFDVLGAYIIIIAVMLICIIVISGKAILTYVAKKSKHTLEERLEYQRLKKEQYEASNGKENENGSGRRPPKTFVLDGNASSEAGKTGHIINFKERKEKNKSLKNEDIPISNLDHLFQNQDEKETELQMNDFNETDKTVTVPNYEDELRSKFGAEGDLVNVVPEEEPITSQDTDVVQSGSVKKVKGNDTSSDSTSIEQLDIKQVAEQKEYIFPPVNLLNSVKGKSSGKMSDRSLKETAIKLQNTLESFGVHVTITNVSCGPAVTRYELQPEQGVKVSKITSLADDIKLNLAAADVRIEAPIPGKAAVGIEVPNKENSMVSFRDLIESKEFQEHPSDIAFGVGKDIGGQTIITDIAKMPHLLIAGATGSGKSVCINTLIMSILYKSNPSDVRLIMVDPKVVELNVYNGIPHLLIPVVTDPKKASAALSWAVMEMTERYKKFADVGVRDLKGYNDKVAEVAYLNDENYQKLPQIVIIIDELADLMMVAPGEVEDAICRLAQMARAAGLHLIIATQRPSVNVITGLIKANIPSRIAFAVSSAIDSRTILDGSGAEKLLGKGDMLFFPSGYPKPVRIQGAFISDKEVSSVVEFLKKNNNEAQYSEDIKEKITNARPSDGGSGIGGGNDRDEYFAEAGKFIIEKDKASIGMLQRVYKIGFNRAARIMDQLAEAGVVGPEEGTKPRKVLMSSEQFEQYLEEY